MNLRKMGFVDKKPALAIIQAEGCAPMVHAWKEQAESASPVTSPRTHIETLATGDPGRSYTLLKKKVSETNGTL